LARIIAAICLLASAAAPSGARAFDGPGCGGSYNRRATCGPFAVRGLPILLYGDSETAGAGRVYLTIAGNPEIPPVFECSWPAPGGSQQSCDRGYPSRTTTFNIPEPYGTFDVMCHVESPGVGQYYCQTGRYET
jgi:hypothetical protein